MICLTLICASKQNPIELANEIVQLTNAIKKEATERLKSNTQYKGGVTLLEYDEPYVIDVPSNHKYKGNYEEFISYRKNIRKKICCIENELKSGEVCENILEIIKPLQDQTNKNKSEVKDYTQGNHSECGWFELFIDYYIISEDSGLSLIKIVKNKIEELNNKQELNDKQVSGPKKSKKRKKPKNKKGTCHDLQNQKIENIEEKDKTVSRLEKDETDSSTSKESEVSPMISTVNESTNNQNPITE